MDDQTVLQQSLSFLSSKGRGHKRVCAGLRQCIDAHGPITKESIGSAAKRILRELRAELREVNGNG